MAVSRYRSVRTDLAAALNLARAVERAGGSAAAGDVAAALGYSGTNNGTYLTRVANARLFGVVKGRLGRVEVTELGQRALSEEQPVALAARREALLRVPLFRALLEDAWATGSPLPQGTAELAHLLEERFGEAPSKSRTVAGKFLSSLTAAGLEGAQGAQTAEDVQVGPFSTGFTNATNPPSTEVVPAVRWRATRSRRGEDVETNLWLDEQPDGEPPRGVPAGPGGGARGARGRRTVAAVAAVVVLVALVAVPLALASGAPGARRAAGHGSSGHPAAAERAVISALGATAGSGSFDVSYRLSATPATTTAATTTTTVCSEREFVSPPPAPAGGPGRTGPEGTATDSGGGWIAATGDNPSGSSGSATTTGSPPATGGPVPPNVPSDELPVLSSAPPAERPLLHKLNEVVRMCSAGPQAQGDTTVEGSGVIDTSPLAMVVSAQIGTTAHPDSGLQVVVRVDSSSVYENLGSTTASLAPPPDAAMAGGQEIAGFAGITESTLGQREGAVAMMGMASPTGYLDLQQQQVAGADQVGTSTVDGDPVTVYKVVENPSQVADVPGTSPLEAATIAAANRVLQSQGYTGSTVLVSVDASGFIRQSVTTTTFSDGGTVVLSATFSDFGCAGTVLMPGQQGSATPPSGCTSPGTAHTGTAPSSTTAPETSSTTTSVPGGAGRSTPTTVAGTVPSTTSTTVASPTDVLPPSVAPPVSVPTTVPSVATSTDSGGQLGTGTDGG